jgi:hypothetical protein
LNSKEIPPGGLQEGFLFLYNKAVYKKSIIKILLPQAAGNEN